MGAESFPGVNGSECGGNYRPLSSDGLRTGWSYTSVCTGMSWGDLYLLFYFSYFNELEIQAVIAMKCGFQVQTLSDSRKF
jgi:hypothetical protein